MIPVIVCQIEVSEFLSPKTSERKVRAGFAATHRAMARQAEVFLPRHTAPDASRRYGYVRRKPGYVKRAKALYPGWSPMHATGELERSLIANNGASGDYRQGRLRIRAVLGEQTWITQQGKIVRVGVTQRFRMKEGQISLSAQQEQMQHRVSEITATTADEEREIGRAGGTAFVSYIQSNGRTKIRV